MLNIRRKLFGKVIALIGTVLIASHSAFAVQPDSKGTDFWLMFNANLAGSGEELSLFITGDTATTGTVDIPGLAFSSPVSVTPGTVTTVVLPLSAAETSLNLVGNKGIHVTSVDEVTVYGLNRRQFTTDAYLGLPTDILGTEYINQGYENVNVLNASQFGVVAAEDNTTVTITPSAAASGHPAGVPFNITMNQGQTYQLRNTIGGQDLSGSIIESDKPIAVFGGHQCANIPRGFIACDHLVEQLSPTSTWGQSFVTLPLATRTGGDTFRVLASENVTTVSIDGAVVATLNRGEFYENILVDASTINADKPIFVTQYSNSSTFDNVTSDPFEVLIPPFEQFLASYTITTPATGFATNFVNVVTPDAAVGGITLDGVAIPAGDFSTIGSSGFSGAQVPVALGSHSLAGPLPFGLTTYGFDSFDSYGYPGGLALAEVAELTDLDLNPATATNPLDTEHCVVATTTDQNSDPLPGIRVDFDVTGANTTNGFAFTDANGDAEFCYTGTNAGADTITASVGDRTATATKEWVAEDDTTPPECALTNVIPGPPTSIEVTTSDAGSGLASIVVLIANNASVVIPAFSPGTTDPVIVVGTKINQSTSAQVALQVTDVAGNVTDCDPVITAVIRENGKPVSDTFTDIPQAESNVTVTNGDPGIKHLDLIVNGETFKIKSLHTSEERTIDVSSAMVEGNGNTITLTARGKPGGSAVVLISD